MNTLLKHSSKPRQIRKSVILIASSPQYHKYSADLNDMSENFWTSPSPSTSFERYQLGSDMLPPFSGTPPAKNNKHLQKIMSYLKDVETKKSVKSESDSTNYTLDEGMLFHCE